MHLMNVIETLHDLNQEVLDDIFGYLFFRLFQLLKPVVQITMLTKLHHNN